MSAKILKAQGAFKALGGPRSKDAILLKWTVEILMDIYNIPQKVADEAYDLACTEMHERRVGNRNVIEVPFVQEGG